MTSLFYSTSNKITRFIVIIFWTILIASSTTFGITLVSDENGQNLGHDGISTLGSTEESEQNLGGESDISTNDVNDHLPMTSFFDDQSELSYDQKCSSEGSRDSRYHCKTDEIVVEVDPSLSLEQIKALAEKHGYTFEGPVGSIENTYYFKRKDGRRVKREAFRPLMEDSNILWAKEQIARKRVKRDFIKDNNVAAPVSYVKLPWTDPLYTKQWYLRKGAVGGYDMQVQEAWETGYSGKGIVVSILDDGVQGSHPDLYANYDPLASKDINEGDDDPTPRDNGDNKHGTRCAGEVASVAGNNWCGVGIAYNARIGGVRMLDGPVSDRVEGAALSHNQNHIDIYSASWGPDDDGQTFDGPGALAKKAFFMGITKGRQGKGNIFIWASGNGGSYQDSCSCDGYTTSIYTLSVSSATFDNRRPWYLEECPSSLTTTYSSANRGQPAIISTDMPNLCTDQHTGTSASAPIAAAIVALALEANGNLTWRDMQHLVVRTSNPTPLLENQGWIKNGVGRMVSNAFGYGLMNAGYLVKMAKKWKTVPPQHVCSYEYKMKEPEPLRGKFERNYTMYVGGDCLQYRSVVYLEHVQALISIQFKRRGDLVIVLTSPMGTRSVLLPKRPRDDFKSGFQKWPFLSVQQWGENPKGTWTLTIINAGYESNTGTFHDWTLTMHGTDVPAQPDEDRKLQQVKPGSGVTNGVGRINAQLDSSQSQVEYPRHALEAEDGDWGHVDRRQQLQHDIVDAGGALRNGGGRTVGGGGVATSDLLFGGARGATDAIGDGRDLKVLHEQCHSECVQNDGCYVVNSAQDCVSCKNYKHFLRNRGGVRCVAQCESGYYADDRTKRCNQCLNGCATCSGPEFCDTCLPGAFLVDINPEHFHHGKCATQCPEGYVNVTDEGTTRKCVAVCGNNCLTCENDNECRYCKENYFMSPARQCLATCPEYYYANKEKRKCEDCSPNCVKCLNNKDCTECAQAYVWNATSAKCLIARPKSCKANGDCFKGQYCESSDNQCQGCHTDCTECEGPSFDQCTICKNGQPTDPRTRQCLPCHAGQYYKPETGECLPCDKSCSVCLGPSRTQCAKCNKGYKQLGAICEACCTKETMSGHGIYCVSCLEEDRSSKLASYSSSNLLRITVGLLIAGILFSGILMLVLMCRDRNYLRGARKYAYSKIPVNYDLASENKLIINGDNDVAINPTPITKHGTMNNNNNYSTLEHQDLLQSEEEYIDGDEEDIVDAENQQEHEDTIVVFDKQYLPKRER